MKTSSDSESSSKSSTNLENKCDIDNCECGSLPRRAFLQKSSTAIGAASVFGAQNLPVMAGPFEENDYLNTIPVDKKLSPDWVRSLFERGKKQVYTKTTDLDHIGMPVGGFFAGTVYLSGDGRLWLWDIFNRDQMAILPRDTKQPGGFHGSFLSGGLNYLFPAQVTQPFKLEFSLEIEKESRSLDKKGFNKVSFDGRYPIGRVHLQDDDCPIEATLEAFSPFIPLNLEDSSIPATVMSYKLSNTSKRVVDVDISGIMENPVCPDSRKVLPGLFRNRIASEREFNSLLFSCEPEPIPSTSRPDIMFENFEDQTYVGWKVEGEAFGKGPVKQSDIPDYQGKVGGSGERVVNSHSTAPGDSIPEKDGAIGKMTSRSFKIERRYINLWIGGGSHNGRTCVNLLIDGAIVESITGQSQNQMSQASLNTSAYKGKTARLEIVDNESGAWGNIGVDQIVFSDLPAATGSLPEQTDFGTMALSLLDTECNGTADLSAANPVNDTSQAFGKPLVGRLSKHLSVAPGESKTVTFVISWHFPNFKSRGCGNALVGHHYTTRFGSARQVVRYLARHYDRLAGDTRKWVATWYDSTLPYWFLDRTMANTSTLATTTCHRFQDGRFWAWEGIGCCHGTCTHVWHYAQAPGRLFPELERLEREEVNFGKGFHADGGIGMRTGLNGANEAADDGQCGRILGVLREHQMSHDDQFLRRLWPKVKQAIEYMIRKDGNFDGMLEGAQPNTLDASWYGKISFLASLYLAALRAGEVMAQDMGDKAFEERCASIAAKGSESILELFNGEYFFQKEDPKHAKEVGIGPGCYIDQIFGQTWAHWVGLGHLFDRDKQLSALRALWKYNFVPEIGAFRKTFPRGRWYATAGDAGLIMCSWPKGGQNPAFKDHWQYMYFNECMTGFEWQAAAHMIWEGVDQPDILQYGMAVARAIHDRYDARLRNPYNEIECSDHYARAMASYGAYQSVCGFDYDGPKKQLSFAPRIQKQDFRCAFVTAEAWGTYQQKRNEGKLNAAILCKHGSLLLKHLGVHLQETAPPGKVSATLNGVSILATLERSGDHTWIHFDETIWIRKEDELVIKLT